MLERLITLTTLIILGVALYHGWKWWGLRRAAHLAHHDPLLASFVPGQPAILYFTADGCVACKTQQQPAFARLRSLPGYEAVQIIQVDTDQQLPDAERWGVMSLPTTFVLDSQGQPKAVNYGVASAEKLRKQIQEAIA
ncbi:MAG: thioredoxin family protein [Chloroflexi bacterium]|nr:thioredoxin family protein [Chloroflexota bacterium]